MRARKAFLCTGVTALIVLVNLPELGSQSAVTATSNKTAEQVYKNIQVLKGVPADQVIPAMQFMNASLGVQCDFCHLEDAFDKDNKETKQTARKMMRMMFAINKDNFEGRRQVTCYACHRGAHKPVTTPVLSGDDTKFAEQHMYDEEEADANLPSADQILGNYFRAVGGVEAAGRISTRVQKGILTIGSEHFPLEIAANSPSEQIITVHFPDGDSIAGVNEHGGWVISPGRALREMSSSEADAARMDAELFFPAILKKVFQAFHVQQQGRLNGTEVYRLAASRGNMSATQLYFDQESGLLVRVLRFADSPVGRNPTEIDYGDYREKNGVKTPFRWTVSQASGRFTVQIEEMEQNVPIPARTFMKPTT